MKGSTTIPTAARSGRGQNGDGKPSCLASSSSWLLVEGKGRDRGENSVPGAHLRDPEPTFGADSVVSVGMSSVMSASSSFTTIRLNDTSTASLGSRSTSEISGSSFCKLGASLLKQSLEKDPPKPLESKGGKTSFSFTASESKLSPQNKGASNPPFQKSEAYRHYQRSISSSSDSESDSDSKKKSKSKAELLQVKQESVRLQEQLRQAEAAIDRLQENQRAILPTITKLQSDVALAMARAASAGQGSLHEVPVDAVNWMIKSFSTRFVPRTADFSKSTCALMDMEAGMKQVPASQGRGRGWILAGIVLILFFAATVVLTMFLVPDFEMSQGFGWIPVWFHGPPNKPGPQAKIYREDPL